MTSRCRLPLAVLLVLLGCGSPRVDTSSDEKMEESLKRARESLPSDQRDEFDAAVQTLSLSQLDWASLLTAGANPNAANSVVANVKEVLNGKTAEEIISAADDVVAAREAQEREKALQEIAELLKERDAALQSAAELTKFEILRSRFYKERDYFGSWKPHILLRVRNGTNVPVSRAYFRGRITSPGRSVAWLEEEFNYSIRGGIEAGEEAEWVLLPNQFSEWGTVNAPPEAGLEVTVIGLDGPDGESAFSTRDFTKEDEARLLALQTEYGQ